MSIRLRLNESRHGSLDFADPPSQREFSGGTISAVLETDGGSALVVSDVSATGTVVTMDVTPNGNAVEGGAYSVRVLCSFTTGEVLSECLAVLVEKC